MQLQSSSEKLILCIEWWQNGVFWMWQNRYTPVLMTAVVACTRSRSRCTRSSQSTFHDGEELTSSPTLLRSYWRPMADIGERISFGQGCGPSIGLTMLQGNGPLPTNIWVIQIDLGRGLKNLKIFCVIYVCPVPLIKHLLLQMIKWTKMPRVDAQISLSGSVPVTLHLRSICISTFINNLCLLIVI